MGGIAQGKAREPELDRSRLDAPKHRRGTPRVLGLGPVASGRVRPRRSLTLVLAATWVALVLLLAITANWLPIRNPIVPIGASNAPPHWGSQFLGLDVVGRSMLSRLVYGARTSYLIAVCTTAIALCVGCLIGLLAVYFRGAVNFFADLLSNVILSIPGLLLLITIASVVTPSYEEVIGSIALVLLPGFIRVSRSIALAQIEGLYVVAARGLGASPARIIVRELLPNTLVALITYAGIVLPSVMLTEGGLSYLGLGVPPPASSWGEMVALGQADIAQAPWQAIIPSIIFAVNVFALFILADWLRARLDLKGGDIQ
jgi:peptide/nickel transport system permease protein